MLDAGYSYARLDVPLSVWAFVSVSTVNPAETGEPIEMRDVWARGRNQGVQTGAT